MDALRNPTVYISSLRIDEPVTTLTDLIVAFIGIMAFLKTRSANNSRSVNLYRWFFLLTGISTGVSSLIGHAFAYVFGPEFKLIGWILGIASVTFAQFAAIYHARTTLPNTIFKALGVLNGLETAASLVLLLGMRTFLPVEIHSAFGLLLIVTTLEARYYARTKSILSRYLITGVGISVLAVTCHLAKLAISPWFNHLDISHVFMAIALFTMYRGVQKEQQINTL